MTLHAKRYPSYFSLAYDRDLYYRFRNGKEWELARDFKAVIQGQAGEPLRLVIPSGFVTDNASIPNFPITRWIFPASDVYDKIAVVHDLLCVEGPKGYCSHQFAHWVWASGVDQLKRQGQISAWRAWCLSQAVVRFGPRW